MVRSGSKRRHTARLRRIRPSQRRHACHHIRRHDRVRPLLERPIRALHIQLGVEKTQPIGQKRPLLAKPSTRPQLHPDRQQNLFIRRPRKRVQRPQRQRAQIPKRLVHTRAEHKRRL